MKETDCIDFYNNNPDYLSVNWFDLLRAMRALKINPLEYKTVLDLGCGDGRFSHNFQQCFGAQIEGMDYSSIRIDKARKDYPNICFYCCNILVGYNNIMGFDLVLLLEVLEHLEDPTTLIERIHCPLFASVPINLPLDVHRHVFKTKEDVRQIFDGEIYEDDRTFWLWKK